MHFDIHCEIHFVLLLLHKNNEEQRLFRNDCSKANKVNVNIFYRFAFVWPTDGIEKKKNPTNLPQEIVNIIKRFYFLAIRNVEKRNVKVKVMNAELNKHAKTHIGNGRQKERADVVQFYVVSYK